MKRALLLAPLLLGCQPDKPPRSYQHRVDDGPVVVSRHTLAGGEFLHIQTPSALLRGMPIADTHCYVWRDLEFQTSSLYCPPVDYVAP